MAMRRPRIKAQANIHLNAKRKPKIAETKPKIVESASCVVTPEDVPGHLSLESALDTIEKENQRQQQESDDSVGGYIGETASEKGVTCSIISNSNDTNAIPENNLNNTNKNVGSNRNEYAVGVGDKNRLKTGNDQHNESLVTPDAFKCPPKVGYQRSVSHTSNSGADDVFYSDIEENALQMDLQRSPNGCPMSPKNQTRQRIKATPIFGQRRNSFVATSPSPHTTGSDDIQLTFSNGNEFVEPTQRRERHISASLSNNSNSSSANNHHTTHKYQPNGVVQGGMGRMRTESGCSVFSDTNVSTHKARKAEHHKFVLKREYEARFVNGVPDKSCIKMSDLIYYNPATNPMEQKSNPNVKLENNDSKATLSSDMKPFNDKVEQDCLVEEESEAMPVPQLKLDSNGELILDDKSLVIETTAEQEARKVLANSSLIYLDEYTGMNGFYSRQKRTREWQSSETVKFYRCLQTVGTDFSLMVQLFPNRTRRDLKLKFKKEERINGNLINKALLYPKQFNIEVLKQQMEEEEKRFEEEANRLKQLKEAAKAKAPKKVRNRKHVRSSADCALNGGNVYQNEDGPKSKKPRNSPKISGSETNATEKSKDPADDAESNNQCKTAADSLKTDIKRRRRREPNNIQREEVIDLDVEAPQSIKVEMIKNEPTVSSLSKMETSENHHKDGHREKDIELSHSNGTDMDNTSDSYAGISEPTVSITESVMNLHPLTFLHGDGYFEESVIHDNESRTFVNLDDGSVTTVNDLNRPADEHEELQQPSPSVQPIPLSPSTASEPMVQEHFHDTSPPLTPMSIHSQSASYLEFISNDTCSSVASERELNERDIQQILTELAEGSLVLVSTLDPDDPDKVLNEIFMVDKNTGDLCDEPLNIPDNIIQCILSVMS